MWPFRKRKIVAIVPITLPVFNDGDRLVGWRLDWKVVREAA